MQEESKDEQPEPEPVMVESEEEAYVPTQIDPEGFFNASDDVSLTSLTFIYLELFG